MNEPVVKFQRLAPGAKSMLQQNAPWYAKALDLSFKNEVMGFQHQIEMQAMVPFDALSFDDWLISPDGVLTSDVYLTNQSGSKIPFGHITIKFNQERQVGA